MSAIGIIKGKPFDPDPRMKKLLTEAATLGNAAGRSITYDPRIAGVKIYPDSKSNWMMGYANKNTSFEADGSMNLDARVLFYYNAGGVTPAMAVTHPGAGVARHSRLLITAFFFCDSFTGEGAEAVEEMGEVRRQIVS
jgi:hypothetical protein